MKQSKPKIIRILGFLLCLSIFVTCLLSGCKNQPDQMTTSSANQTEMTSSLATAPVIEEIVFHVGQQEQKYNLTFADSAKQVPMICLEDAVALLESYIQENRDSNFTLELTVRKEQFVLTRDHGAQCVLDLHAGTLLFPDYNAFHKFSFELGALDILEASGFDSEGQPAYFQRVMCSEKPATSSVIDLAEREIPFFVHKKKGYITLQTFSDLFLTPYEIMLCYNQQEVFLLNGQQLASLTDSYYGGNVTQPDPMLPKLKYRQLCLLLDFHYGLQESHGIQSADEYITQLGLKEPLCSTDPAVSFSALKTLFYKYLSDNHSNVQIHSVFDKEPNYSLGAQEASIGYWEFYKNYQQYNSLRKEQFGEQYQAYAENGDTAFITFDRFSSVTGNYYENAPTKDALADEVALICYAHSRITRQNSPIKNVVIDLATNTGGHMDGGIFLTAWVLGNSIIHISDPIRQAEGTFLYRADVNLDRAFDSNDTISDKNVFVIVSPLTFSCANYAAYALKESGKVTLLGSTSGGGSGCVYMASTVDGAAVSFSSGLLISGYKNGSYYDLDVGVEPDVKFAKLSDFFDRRRILEIIHDLV